MPESETNLHSVETSVRGYYRLQPAKNSAAQALLVGCHGYGETSLEQLERLKSIPGDDWHCAAVQALHPFYTRSGQIVACWMTSFEREAAIADNHRYLSAVISDLRRALPETSGLVFAGFSQGVAMAYRAAAEATRRGELCRGVIALAGDVPPEVDAASLPPVLIGRGDAESWYSEEKLASDLLRLSKAGIETEVCRFKGGHEWTPEFSQAAAAFLDRVS